MAMTYRPDPELAEQLRVAAFVTRRTRADILTEALRDWLETKGKAAVEGPVPPEPVHREERKP